MSTPRIALGASTAAWLSYLTYVLSAGPSGTSPIRGALLALLTAGVVIAVTGVMLERLGDRLDQLQKDVADFGDRREILGHEIATRAYTNGGRALRPVDD